MTFVGMVAGQIGTAFAVRTRRASLRSIGVFSNRYLLFGIAGELTLAAIFVYAPPLQSLLATAGLPLRDLALLPAYPVIVWGADELRRWVLRRYRPVPAASVVCRRGGPCWSGGPCRHGEARHSRESSATSSAACWASRA